MQTLDNPQTLNKDSKDNWLIRLNELMSLTDTSMLPGNKANLSCNIDGDTNEMFLPANLAEFQPQVLRYLHALSAANNITLVEDRRAIEIQPVTERRLSRPSDLAIGVSLLLKQTGLPGPAHSLSSPHRLNIGNARIELPRLIRMAAELHAKSKRVVFLPNRFITGNFQEDAEPMTGYACKATCDTNNITLGYFNAPEFRAVGYISNDQFVLHVLLAGGSISEPTIWSSLKTLNTSSFRCQIFNSPVPNADFGLLYSTYYIDLEESMEQQQWWSKAFNSTLAASGG